MLSVSLASMSGDGDLSWPRLLRLRQFKLQHAVRRACLNAVDLDVGRDRKPTQVVADIVFLPIGSFASAASSIRPEPRAICASSVPRPGYRSSPWKGRSPGTR